MRIAVSGTRYVLSVHHWKLIDDALRPYEGHVVHVGDCPTGVDKYVRDTWPDIDVFRAEWSLGPQAGPIRNGVMLQGVSALVAFPAPGSKGTLDAIRQAIAAGIETHVYPLRFE